MQSFPSGFKAIVIGASGGLGAAFVQTLDANPHCAQVWGLHRHSTPPIDFADEASIGAAAAALAHAGPFHLVINAAGLLHNADFMPEKKLADLHYAQMLRTLQVNTLGPALLLRHFCPLLAPGRSAMVLLSAKVGSIGDNRLGGWYSYRASKAALNMLVRTAAIEVRRSRPEAVLLAMHPGTVNTGLSQPFKGEQIGRPANDAAQDMLAVVDRLTPADSGGFYAYNGARLPW